MFTYFLLLNLFSILYVLDYFEYLARMVHFVYNVLFSLTKSSVSLNYYKQIVAIWKNVEQLEWNVTMDTWILGNTQKSVRIFPNAKNN